MARVLLGGGTEKRESSALPYTASSIGCSTVSLRILVLLYTTETMNNRSPVLLDTTETKDSWNPELSLYTVETTDSRGLESSYIVEAADSWGFVHCGDHGQQVVGVDVHN